MDGGNHKLHRQNCSVVGFIHQLARSPHHQRCSCCRIRTSTGERSHSKPAEGRSEIFGGRSASQNQMVPRMLLLLALSLCAASAVAGMASTSLRAPHVAAHHPLSARSSQLTGSGVRDKAQLGTVSLGFTVTSTQIRSGFAICNNAFSHPTACSGRWHRRCCAFASSPRTLDQIYRPFPWTSLSRSMCRVPISLPAACHQIRSVGCSCMIREEHDCRVGRSLGLAKGHK